MQIILDQFQEYPYSPSITTRQVQTNRDPM